MRCLTTVVGLVSVPDTTRPSNEGLRRKVGECPATAFYVRFFVLLAILAVLSAVLAGNDPWGPW